MFANKDHAATFARVVSDNGSCKGLKGVTKKNSSAASGGPRAGEIFSRCLRSARCHSTAGQVRPEDTLGIIDMAMHFPNPVHGSGMFVVAMHTHVHVHTQIQA